MLEVLIAIEDPGAFTTPESVIQDRPLTESACAENNLGHFNFGVAPLPQDDSSDF